MYFVDREKIGQLLTFIDKQMAILSENDSWSSEVEKLALERIAHTIIDGVLDVGNKIIDGFIMRDPGSYHDIIDILEDEKVITEEMALGLKKLIDLRKMLVQEYDLVQHEPLLTVFNEQLDVLKKFSTCVNTYLEKELGPVNAFKNE